MSKDDCYKSSLAEGLSKLQHEQRYTDVILVCEEYEEEFHAHKVILSALSPYFDAMFQCPMTETETGRVHLPFSREQCRNLIQFAYTGEINIRYDNAASFLEFGHMIQMESLKTYCNNFLIKNLHKNNCLSVWQLAVLQEHLELALKAKNMVTKYFEDIYETNDFQELREVDFIWEILQSAEMNCPNKTNLITAVLLWINGDNENRLCYLVDLILKIKNDFDLPRSVIEEKIEFFPEIKNSVESQTLIASLKECGRGIPTKLSVNIDECLIVITDSIVCKREEVFCYSKHQKRWFQFGKPPQTLKSYFATCPYGTNLFVSGGLGNNRAFWQFDIAHKKWDLYLPPLPEERPRLYHSMSACRDKIFVIGGTRKINGSAISEIDCFNVTSRQWHVFGDFGRGKLFSMPTPVYSCSVLNWDRDILIFGGMKEKQIKSPEVQYFNTEKEYSGIFGKLPENAEAGCQPIELNGSIYIICKNGQVYHFSKQQRSWEFLVALDNNFFPRSNFSLGVQGNSILVMGGERKFKMENEMLQLQIGTSENTFIIKMDEKLPIEMKSVQMHTIYIPRHVLSNSN